MKNIVIIAATTAASLALSGCAPKLGGSDYSVRGVGEVSQTYRGTIVSARPIMIQAKTAEAQSQPGAGALVGGLAGGVLGSQVGKGKGQVVAGALGALGGAAAGHFAEQKLTEQEGMEYQVQLESGALITVAQGAEPRLFVGQRVLVIKSDRERSRVVPA